jgi:hypothetical protein
MQEQQIKTHLVPPFPLASLESLFRSTVDFQLFSMFRIVRCMRKADGPPCLKTLTKTWNTMSNDLKARTMFIKVHAIP